MVIGERWKSSQDLANLNYDEDVFLGAKFTRLIERVEKHSNKKPSNLRVINIDVLSEFNMSSNVQAAQRIN